MELLAIVFFIGLLVTAAVIGAYLEKKEPK
jgi:hypothetical protein